MSSATAFRRPQAREGDIINIDTPPSSMAGHGRHQPHVRRRQRRGEGKRLRDITYEAMMKGIEGGAAGATTGAIAMPSRPMRDASPSGGARFLRPWARAAFSDEPSIPDITAGPATGRAESRHVLTIEPMINAGRYDVKVLADGWTAVTKDKSAVGRIRGFGRRHRDGPRDLHLSRRTHRRTYEEPGVAGRAKTGGRERQPQPIVTAAKPHTTAILTGCASRLSRRAAIRSASRLPRTHPMAAIPQKDVKPLAWDLIKRFGPSPRGWPGARRGRSWREGQAGRGHGA